MTGSERKYTDPFGNVSVRVEVGREGKTDTRYVGWNHKPSVVAAELRALADQVEASR